MKIIIEEPTEQEEDKVIIRCRELDENLLRLIQGLKMNQDTIIAHDKNMTYMLEPEEVFYFESVDNRVYIYCKNKVFESKQKLYEIESCFEKWRENNYFSSICW